MQLSECAGARVPQRSFVCVSWINNLAENVHLVGSNHITFDSYTYLASNFRLFFFFSIHLRIRSLILISIVLPADMRSINLNTIAISNHHRLLITRNEQHNGDAVNLPIRFSKLGDKRVALRDDKRRPLTVLAFWKGHLNAIAKRIAHMCVWVCDAKHQSTRCCNRNCGKRQSFHCSLRSLWNSFFPPSFLCSAAVCCCCRLKRIRANNLKYFLIWSNGVETVATVSRCRRRWCWQNRNIITNGVTVKFVPPPMSWTQIRKMKKKKTAVSNENWKDHFCTNYVKCSRAANEAEGKKKQFYIYIHSLPSRLSLSLSLSLSQCESPEPVEIIK